MSAAIEHIRASTTHARLGGPRNAFTYGVDYLLVDPEASATSWFFSLNRRNVSSVDVADYGPLGGPLKGAAWARAVFAGAGLEGGYDLRLLTQPAVLGYVFNPVSFWFALREGRAVAFIAEVNNTGGDRHSYLCHAPDLRPIEPGEVLTAEKQMHVSPFQEVAGDYRFSLDFGLERIAIRILHRNGAAGLCATLSGARAPFTARGLLAALARRPVAGLRTITLIHWQALRLAAKRARFHRRPQPPSTDVTICSR